MCVGELTIKAPVEGAATPRCNSPSWILCVGELKKMYQGRVQQRLTVIWGVRVETKKEYRWRVQQRLAVTVLHGSRTALIVEVGEKHFEATLGMREIQ